MAEPDNNIFKSINPDEYFDHSHARTAAKTATIQARPADAGEEIVTVMKDGHVETKNTAKAGDYVVTNPDGERYIVPGEKFDKKYVQTDTPGVFKPAGGPVKVMPLQEDVSFKAPWGEEMKIKAGGVLVYNGPGDVYGIQPEEFKKTYSFVDEGADAARDAARSAGHADDALQGAGKLVGKLGAVGGLVAGAYFAIEGDMEAAAAVAIPGAESTIALAKGDYRHAVIAGVDEFTFGAASLATSIDVKPIELNDEQQAFFQIYDRLPSQATEDMPPEVASLVEYKKLILNAEEKFAAEDGIGQLGSDAMTAREDARSKLESAQEMYQQQYDDLQTGGGLAIVANYLVAQPAHQDATAGANVAAPDQEAPAVTSVASLRIPRM